MAVQVNSNTVKVEQGDTLSKIAQVYLGASNRWPELAKINGLSNPHHIVVGQLIKLSGSTSTTTSGTKMTAPKITQIGIQNGTSRDVYVAWSWDRHADTEKYEGEWYYDTGDSLEWFHGGNVDSGTRQHCKFTAPENAKRVMFMVRPVAKTTKKG